ncbi:polyketide synthase [Beauveria brongniartii RCEF 3172]|uniref:Polyketide synthase n=1 Tax=Beauveria brongniartii RCEF 3172 TaxID=1081107 RepID=A0A167H1L0_9HYPO|nr:polyketide synthase [Beauveria brongniartii RCEF 3172]
MGIELIPRFSIYAQSLRQMDKILYSLGTGWSLMDELAKSEHETRIHDAELCQPSCTALQIALVDLLHSWHVHPEFVCGHSSGEIAAAYAAGVLTASDAIKVAYHRGQAVQYLRKIVPDRKGSMLAVGLGEEDVRRHLTALYKGKVTVACINSPENVTLSGDESAIDSIANEFKAAKIFCRKLLVGVAYHSQHMTLVESFYRSAIRDTVARDGKPGVKMVSSVTGRLITGRQLDSLYWVQNLLSPVLFSDAVSEILSLARDQTASGVVRSNIMIEVGPHSALKSPMMQIFKHKTAMHLANYLSCLTRDVDGHKTCLQLAADLFMLGAPIDVNSANKMDNKDTSLPQAQVLTNLPSYNWHHDSRHWNESRRSAAYRLREDPRHELLGNPTADNVSQEPSWHHYLRLSELPWMKGHCVDQQVVFPAAGYVCIMIEAMKKIAFPYGWRDKVIKLSKVSIDRPLLIQREDQGVLRTEVITSARPYAPCSYRTEAKAWEFRIFSISPANEATEHCRGMATALDAYRQDLLYQLQLNNVQDGNGDTVDGWENREPIDLYRTLKVAGADYSGSFACLEAIKIQPWHCRATIQVPDVASTMPSHYQQLQILHPTVLDGCFHACLAALWQADALETALVITEIEEMTVSTNMDLRPGQRLFVRSNARTFGLDKYSGDIVVSDTNQSDADNGMGQNWIRVKGLRLAPSQGFDQARTDEAEERRQCHRIEWRVDPFLTLPDVLAQHCRRRLDELRSPSLRKQGHVFCQSAIARQMFQLNALVENDSVAPEHLQFYLQWLRSQDMLGAPIVDADLENATMAIGATGEALLTIDENLKQLLLGRVDGLSLLLKRDLLCRLYAEDDCVNRCHHQLIEYMRLVKFKMGRLRILEIGGGIGNLTIPVMKALFCESRHDQQPGTSQGLYVVTDISSVYFASLQKTLQEFSSVMQYRTFDMEKPPSDQGLELGSFDVILASNVIHAAANICEGLRNLRQLLGPGGQIVMVEMTEPSLRWTMTLGSLTGWWAGAGSSKATPPFMKTSQWDSVLQSSGLSGVSVEMKDYEAPEDHECSLLVTHQIDSSASDTGAARCHSLSNILLVRGTEPDETKTALTIRDAMVSQCLDNKTKIDMTTASEMVPCAELASALLVFLPGTLQECWIAPSETCWYNIRDSITSAKSVLLVTKDGALNCSGSDGAIVSGLGRALRAENHDLDLFTLDLGNDSPDHVIASHFVQVYRSLVDPQRTTPHSLWEWEVAAREECILIPRLVQDSKMHDWVQDSVSKYHPRYEIIESSDNRALKLRVGPSKTLDSLYWADAPSHCQSPQGSQVRVRVENVALNFKDLMTIMGELPGLSTILIEGSGIVTDTGDDISPSSLQAGDRVCFFAADGLATKCNLDRNHVAKIPDGMSMQAAAAIPVAYSTSLFALRDIARLRPAGAVGQAAISLAQHLQAGMILVTAGRPERREFIEKKFGIPAHRIVSNRHATFSQRILELTGGAGVDVALNSLAGDAIQETLSVMAPFGRFIEIGKKDMLVNTKLNMQQLENNISLSTVDMTLVAARRPAAFQELLSTSLHLIHTKAVHLLEPITATPAGEVENQFRTMQAGKHLGKLILNLKSSELLKVQPATPSRASLQSNKSYLVVGGTGGLGKAIIRLLVKMGAKRIVTLSRSGAAAAGMAAFVKEMAMAGVQVMPVKGSVLDNSSLDEVKAAAGDMAIKGVIQAAMALHTPKDAAFEQMSHSEWCDGIHPKVQGTMSLDRKISKLDFFILLSSFNGIVGMPGQANYCAANTFLDAFARQKASLGQPARSIDLGLIHNEGTVAEIEAVGRNQYAHGLGPYGVNVLFALINYCIQNPVAASPEEAQILCGGRRTNPTSSASSASRQRPDMRFAHARSSGSSQATHRKTTRGGMAVQSALKAAITPQAAVEAVFAGLKQKLAGMLSISIDDVQADRSVASYGVDSLISVELRNWVRDELAAQIQSIELMSSLSIMQLAETMARRSRLVSAVLFNGTDADA